MPIVSRRQFLTLTGLTVAGICTQQIIPTWGREKFFTPFKFAFIPDLHLSTLRYDNWILYNESLIILQEVINKLNGMELDFVVFGGDLIHNNSKDYKDLPLLLDVLYPLNKPYFVIFGDREADISYLYSKDDFTREFRRFGFLDKTRTYWHHQPVAGLDLIGLDSSIIGKQYGCVPQEQLLWLDATLRKNPTNFKVVTIHHPALPTNDKLPSMRNFELENNQELLTIINKHGTVDLVLSGHRHLNYIDSSDTTYYINSPSIVTYPCQFRTFDVSPTEVKLDVVEIPFKQIVDKARDQLIYSDYARETGMKVKDVDNLHMGKSSDRKQKIKL